MIDRLIFHIRRTVESCNDKEKKEKIRQKKKDIRDNLTKRLFYDDVTIKYYTH